jgi:hypothetical protein
MIGKHCQGVDIDLFIGYFWSMERPKAKTHTISLYPKDAVMLERLVKAISKEIGWVSKSDVIRKLISEAADFRGIKS